MAQIVGIIGFFMALLAIFVSSEFSRRTNQRMLAIETEFFKLSGRIMHLEQRLSEIEATPTTSAADRKRQKETLLALEKKTRNTRSSANLTEYESAERYTPSQYKRTLGKG